MDRHGHRRGGPRCRPRPSTRPLWTASAVALTSTALISAPHRPVTRSDTGSSSTGASRARCTRPARASPCSGPLADDSHALLLSPCPPRPPHRGIAAAGRRVGARLVRALRFAAIVWLPIVLVNVLVSREGLTVFLRLGNLGPFGQGDLTVEALVYGAVIALKVTLLVAITTLASLTIDPDEALRIVRRLSFRSALTVSLATRMIRPRRRRPADGRGPAHAPRGPPRGARGRVGLSWR